jgi:hypothetical protein
MNISCHKTWKDHIVAATKRIMTSNGDDNIPSAKLHVVAREMGITDTPVPFGDYLIVECHQPNDVSTNDIGTVISTSIACDNNNDGDDDDKKVAVAGGTKDSSSSSVCHEVLTQDSVTNNRGILPCTSDSESLLGVTSKETNEGLKGVKSSELMTSIDHNHKAAPMFPKVTNKSTDSKNHEAALVYPNKPTIKYTQKYIARETTKYMEDNDDFTFALLNDATTLNMIEAESSTKYYSKPTGAELVHNGGGCNRTEPTRQSIDD